MWGGVKQMTASVWTCNWAPGWWGAILWEAQSSHWEAQAANGLLLWVCLNFRLSLTLNEPLKMQEDFTVHSGQRIPEAAAVCKLSVLSSSAAWPWLCSSLLWSGRTPHCSITIYSIYLCNYNYVELIGCPSRICDEFKKNNELIKIN